jgi:hypothetical protein
MPWSFWNLVSEVTLHQMCHNLFTKSRNPAHAKREEVVHGCKYQEVGILVGHFAYCILHWDVIALVLVNALHHYILCSVPLLSIFLKSWIVFIKP